MRKNNLATLFAATAFISIAALPAHAVFKCTVDNKVTYQDTPCANEVKQKGGQAEIAPPPRKNDLISGPTATSKAENDRRTGTIKSELEPLARNAFAAYKSGRMMEYRDMSCLDLRRALSKPQLLDALKLEGASYATRKIELGKLESAPVAEMLTFLATEVKDPSKTWHRPPEQLFVNMTLAFEEGKPCIRGMSSYTKEIR